MPTLGCIIIFQISVPMTGAIIMGKMSVGVKIFANARVSVEQHGHDQAQDQLDAGGEQA